MHHAKYYDKHGQLIRFEIDGVEQSFPNDQLGTRIEKLAQPIARGIDKIAGTNISGCLGCKKMRERLNSGMNIVEATTVRALEFGIKKLGGHRKTILSKVDARLKSQAK
jgi:hypothetical protein